MYSVASRIVNTALFLFALSFACDTQPGANAQTGPRESIRETPKAGGASNDARPEQLSYPRELLSETVLPDDPYFFQPPTRVNRYDVWQFYDIARFGQFRPRVIYAPQGSSFYLYDGRPYPWVSTHSLDFALRIVGPW
jgi:hypothetical protein